MPSLKPIEPEDHRDAFWKNAEHGNTKFVGRFEYYRNDRRFVLISTNGGKRFTYRSVEQAKRNGWKKCG